jgi:glycosyltransferase involved in cell wall biosynthesis
MQFQILSFEGPDAYSRAGGLATRVEGLADSIVAQGFDTHLWYVGAPDLPGHEQHGRLHLHRWCQWLSRNSPGGVYEDETEKVADYAASLPVYLLDEVMLPHVSRGGHAVVLAEEWQTVPAVLRLDEALRRARLRDRVSILWNANNIFGFEQIPWPKLSKAAVITTVSRYMKHRMREWGIDAIVIPNGLPPDAFDRPDRARLQDLRRRFRGRTALTKMARWDPDKRWIETIRIIAEMKRQGWCPLLVARGGWEPHGREVLQAASELGLKVVECSAPRAGPEALCEALESGENADVVHLRSFVDPETRRVLFRGSDAVLANSGHEPFGLVGLETMAAGGIACTGSSGEDYAVPGQNALVLETSEPREFMGLFRRLRSRPEEVQALRRAGQSTARRYAWSEIVQRVLLPRVEPDGEMSVQTAPKPEHPARRGAPKPAGGPALPTVPDAARPPLCAAAEPAVG